MSISTPTSGDPDVPTRSAMARPATVPRKPLAALATMPGCVGTTLSKIGAAKGITPDLDGQLRPRMDSKGLHAPDGPPQVTAIPGSDRGA